MKIDVLVSKVDMLLSEREQGRKRGQEHSVGASLSSVQAGRVPDGMDERYWAIGFSSTMAIANSGAN